MPLSADVRHDSSTTASRHVACGSGLPKRRTASSRSPRPSCWSTARAGSPTFCARDGRSSTPDAGRMEASSCAHEDEAHEPGVAHASSNRVAATAASSSRQWSKATSSYRCVDAQCGRPARRCPREHGFGRDVVGTEEGTTGTWRTKIHHLAEVQSTPRLEEETNC
jgi:hypothetical protein